MVLGCFHCPTMKTGTHMRSAPYGSLEITGICRNCTNKEDCSTNNCKEATRPILPATTSRLSAVVLVTFRDTHIEQLEVCEVAAVAELSWQRSH